MEIIQNLLSARRLSGRDAFHRRVFELLLGVPRSRQDMILTPSDATHLKEILSRWLLEAPVGDTHGVLRLLAVKKPLRTMIRLTGESFREFLCNTLSLEIQGSLTPQYLPAWKQKKLAGLADASLLNVKALDGWQAHNPGDARLAAISCLDACPLDEEAAQATADIGRWLVSAPPTELPTLYLEHCQQSAFFVSYLADQDRHDFKKAIVCQAKTMVDRLPIPPLQPKATPSNNPPRLTIVGELLFPQHAMFRCYAESLAGFKSKFQVTLIADEPTRCPEHTQISHSQVYFSPQERDVARLAQMVISTRPDIILYPSIGMSYWTFALSLFRLAPLQLMSVGHPAPSCSEAIDGTLVYEELATASLPAYGRMITYGSQPLPAPPPDGWRQHAMGANSQLAIAINAASMKLTPCFLRIVAQIVGLASSEIQLHFYPNLAGAELAALRSELLARFPQAIVHSIKPYSDYMQSLSEADLILQSFPFGGTNTAMDALALGTPLVCMETDDLPAAVDPLLLNYAGMGDLCAKTTEEYVRIATRLLNSQAERERVAAHSKVALAKLSAVQTKLQGKSMADAVIQTWGAGFQ